MSDGVLTRQVLLDAMENIMNQPPKAPSPCGCGSCVVSVRTKERLEREGGFAICATCGVGFIIPAPSDTIRR